MTTRLFVDANVMVRCCVGHASADVTALRRRGIVLATTGTQAEETRKVLIGVFGLAPEVAAGQVDEIVSGFELYDAATYADHAETARSRMHYKNLRDWPLLAAALAADGDIWTDDRDFFGVGAPIWSSRNLRFIERADA